MKKYIIFLLLLLIIPINVLAFEKATDTTHESYLIPYYTNLFNDYNYSTYKKALEIVNNSPKNNANYRYDYIITKNYNGTITIIQVGHNQTYLNLRYSKSSNYYSFAIDKVDTSVPSTAIYFETMTITSSTTATTFSGKSSNGYAFFSSYSGYSTSGYNGSNFINNNDILYSTISIKLSGSNIYNDNILRKMSTFGIPYKYSDISSLDSSGKQEYYKNMNFQKYGKITTQILKSGDTFYNFDLRGTNYLISSETYKNVTITIPNNMAIAEGSFDVQFKTDNYIANPPALYGLYNGKYEFITYMYYKLDKFFPNSYIYTISKNSIYADYDNYQELPKTYEGFQIRYDLEKSSSQNSVFIYSGSFEVSLSYDLEDFSYISPSEEGNTGNNTPDEIAGNGKWFERTEEYFKSLGDMELLEKLNPIYWIRGLAYVFIDLLVPTKEDNSFQQVYDTIYEKFPIINDLKSIIEQVFDESLINTPNQAPKITINLAPLGIGLGTYTLIDFAIFDDFISYIRIFIVSFMLLELVFWYYRKIGSVI